MKKGISIFLIMVLVLVSVPCIATSTGDLEAPQLSFMDPYITIQAQNDANVYYALGGSDPILNGELYSAPIRIETVNTQIRAVAVKDGVISQEATGTYTTSDPLENNEVFVFGGKDDDRFYKVAADDDGFVTIGTSQASSFGNGDLASATARGSLDGIIVKYNNAKEIVWQKHIGGAYNDGLDNVCVTEDGYVVVGDAWSSSFATGDFLNLTAKGAQDGIIAKLDKEGNIVWLKNFGGKGNDTFLSVAADTDGYIVVGYSEETCFGNGDFEGIGSKGERDAVMAKFDTAGEVVWIKAFGGEGFDRFTDITNDGTGYIVSGNSSEESFATGDWLNDEAKGTTDAVLVKYSKDGEVLWKNHFGGSGDDYFDAVTFDETGYIAVGNNYQSSGEDWKGHSSAEGYLDAIAVKYDKNGNLQWKERMGGYDSDAFYDIKADKDGYLVAAYIGADSLTGNFDGLKIPQDETGLVIKYNRDGERIWVKSFPTRREGIALSEAGVAVVGSVNATKLANDKLTHLTGRGGTDATFEMFDYMPTDISYQYAKSEKGTAGISGKEQLVQDDSFLVPVYFTPHKDAVGVNIKITYPSYLTYEKNTGEYQSVYISKESENGDEKSLTLSLDFSLEKMTIPEGKTNVFAVLNFKLNDAPIGTGTITVDSDETMMIDTSSAPTSFEKLNHYTFEVVPISVKEIYIKGNTAVTGKTKYSIEAFPQNAKDKTVTWSVHDETMGTIDTEGCLTPLKNGEITIKAESKNGVTGELAVSATGIKSYIASMTSNVGGFEKEYAEDELNRVLYVPMNTTEITLKATFLSGSIASDYGIIFNGAEKIIDIDSAEQKIILTKKSADCDDTVYTLTVVKCESCVSNAVATHAQDGKTEVDISFRFLPKGVLCVAVYQGKRLQGIKMTELNDEQKNKQVTVDADGDSVRIFVFEDMVHIKPLSHSYPVAVK